MNWNGIWMKITLEKRNCSVKGEGIRKIDCIVCRASWWIYNLQGVICSEFQNRARITLMVDKEYTLDRRQRVYFVACPVISKISFSINLVYILELSAYTTLYLLTPIYHTKRGWLRKEYRSTHSLVLFAEDWMAVS